ncbi:mRNA interferase EndoA [bacterium BMS3Bbin06]|nr:mRNA interferase EndoA [bacterium BMS3Abin08]GBE34856.1 mRNA interferase EndoA [bacterium BMS3Bbin06]HDY70176.1 type II toxin-antitoxin system PemK/MazF family toxin [Nitrospirota bacterium]
MKLPKRGEIYFLDFSPSKGKEMKGPHPALVIQNDVGNKVGALIIVAAITGNFRVAELPVGVSITPEETGRPHKSVIHLGQIYTIDKERLGNFVGAISKDKMSEVNRAIEVSLGLMEFWE